jgi:hypothetical protein
MENPIWKWQRWSYDVTHLRRAAPSCAARTRADTLSQVLAFYLPRFASLSLYPVPTLSYIHLLISVLDGP